MPYILTLPDLGEGIAEAEVVSWYVKEGQWVREGEPLVAVETDKAVFDIPAPATGRVGALEVDEGTVVPVGTRLVSICTGAGDVGDTESQQSSADVSRLPTGTSAQPVKASPRARKLARDLGVEIDSLVRGASAEPLSEADVLAAFEESSKGVVPEKETTVSGVRRRATDRLTRTQREVPAVTVVEECDFTALDRVAEGYARTAFLLKAVSGALEDVPELNATFADGDVTIHDQHDIGVVVHARGGLVVPVVRNVDRRAVPSLTEDVHRLTEKAQASQLFLEELADATFTISDAERLGGLFATPLINAPQVGILGVHRVDERPVVRDGEVVVRRTGNLSCTFDHRAADGFHASLFLQRCIELIELPDRLLAGKGDGSSAPNASEERAAPLDESSLASRLAGAPEERVQTALLEIVCDEAAAILRPDLPGSIDPQRAFKELGFNSVAAVKLRNRLSQASGLRLPSTLVFDHPTPMAVADFLTREVKGGKRAIRAVARVPADVDDPVAIVGMGCRFPGRVSSPEELWELVADGRDAISGFPADRGWDLESLFDPSPDHPERSHAREGGFLYDASKFDAAFFNISPKEALTMDPQQRLLLEGAWEALESAGIDPLGLKGSQTGVFAGVISSEYGYGQVGPLLKAVVGHRVIGAAASVVSGRIAYTFGLEGSAVSIDTACSSSLVAIHLACQALRQGECELALAGGVTVMSTPSMFIEFSAQGALAPDGRCKSFGIGADGTAWSEGVGVLLLERLSEARRNGHRILGLVRGSAVNQDGASNGLTAPNGPSQERVIAQALARAGLSAGDVDAVEAHGTGTTLGDPIEAQALIATYGQGRSGRPLYLGSVKSNIGHTQAAAGIAGVIKMVKAMEHRLLPRSLYCEEPSPHVDWSTGAVELLSEARPWESDGKPRRAGISSFGVSGTNAHVIVEEPPATTILEEAPAVVASPAPSLSSASVSSSLVPFGGLGDGGVVPWLLSAKSEQALFAQAERLGAYLQGVPGFDPVDVGFSLSLRSSLEYRAVLLGSGREELLGCLGALARGGMASGVVRGVASGVGRSGGSVLVFPGQGSQWEGMALELLDSSPVFAEQMCACGEALAPYVDFTLEDVLRGGGSEPGLDRVDVIQPLLFAVMVSLAKLWRACGVKADVVVGHSQGEIAAAYVAGGLSLEDAARVVALRSQALASLAGKGGMVSVALGVGEALSRLGCWDGRVSLAAVNGPSSTVLSGELNALGELVEEWEGDGIRVRMIPVDYAAHSEQVDSIRGLLLEGCSAIEPRSSDVPFFSTVTGELLDTSELDAEYWYRNLRETVQFERVTRAVLGHGHCAFIEVSPHPVLTIGIQETIDSADRDVGEVLLTSSLRREEGGPGRFLSSLAELWVGGGGVDWAQVFAGSGAGRVALPTYAFQRERFWLESSVGVGDVAAVGQVSAGHPLLGAALHLAGGREGWLFTGRISLGGEPWIGDHAVLGRSLLPGTGFLELALAAGERVGAVVVEELTLQAPLLLGERGVQLQVLVGEPDGDGRCEISIHSCLEGLSEGESLRQEWVCHASGVLGMGGVDGPDGGSLAAGVERFASESWPPAGAQELQTEFLYDRVAEAGYEYGPVFQGLRQAWRAGDAIFGEVALNEEQQAQAAGFCVHPALSDAALHGLLLAAVETEQQAGVQVPFSFSGVRLYACGASELRVHLSVQEGAPSLIAVDSAGDPVFSVERIQSRPIDRAALRARAPRAQDALFELGWLPLAAGEGGVGRVVLLGSGGQELDGAGIKLERYLDLDALGAGLVRGAPAPGVVLVSAQSLVEPAGGELAGAVHELTAGVLGLLQGFLAVEGLGEARLVLVTRGALAVRGGEAPDLLQAALPGLLRSACVEHPGRLSLIDIDASEASVAVLVGALASEEPEVALREGELLVPRLARVKADGLDGVEEHDHGEVSAPGLEGDGTILITGGTGGLGALLARHLVERGARRLLLISRSGLKARGARELKASLQELGAKVKVAACDVADGAQLERVIAQIPKAHPLSAVIHTAGVIDDGVISSLDGGRLRRVMDPKVAGALNLHELTRDMELSEFILFSSAAGTLGSPGQGNYAAANTFLDALAAARRAEGLPGSSLAWGQWADASGMTGHLGEVDLARLERSGMLALSSEQGLELFDAARAVGQPLLLPVLLDLAVLRGGARLGLLPGVMRGLVRAPARRGAAAAGQLARRLREAPESEWEAIVLELVRGQVASVLGYASGDAVEVQRNFKEAGFDSLAAVELRNRLVQATGLKLPATLVFDHPTPAAVARFLRERVQGTKRAAPVARRVRSEEPIAIVGLSCRYPGGVASPEEFWELLAGGGDGISEFPSDRGWDLGALYDPDPDHPGTSYARHGGFLYEAGEFDADHFQISPREALAADPQQRLLLEGAWEAFEDAGIDPVGLQGSQTGVFAGIMFQDYGLNLTPRPGGNGLGDLEGYVGTGSASSVATGRVAYAFGLEGPAVSIDTACSSSLVALHLACQALRQGECELALAGGVMVMASPGLFISFSRQRGLALDGRCKSFADAADGTGFSEGVGLVVLERLSEARRKGDRVLALIRGSAVNQDGASNGLTAPNGPSQERVIAQALAASGLSPGEVDAVEAHGTGTVLGDPIEAQALIAAYGQERPDGPLYLGSVKSNIGHTSAAAGVAGVIKMVLALQHGVLPKTLHLGEPSRHVDWSAGAVELLREARPWRANGRPRRAGVSSFGVSGTNAHLILEEAPGLPEPGPAEARDSAPLDGDGCSLDGSSLDGAALGGVALDGAALGGVFAGFGVLPLLVSARSEVALGAQAQRLGARLREDPGLAPLDVAFSLASGRAQLERRAVVVGGDRECLLAGLDALACGESGVGLVRGVARDRGGVVFVFSGQGCQWGGMALGLWESSAVFAAEMDACVGAFAPYLGFSLEDVLRGREGAAVFERVDVLQPALFAVMVSLAALWRSCGVVPGAVVGHSQGEIAAGYVAGGLSLEDAACVVALRSRALADELSGRGGMVSVALGVDGVGSLLEPFAERVALAAVNGPSSVVVSGEPGALGELLLLCEARGLRAKQIPVDYASHSRQVEVIQGRLEGDLAQISPRSGEIPFYSTAVGGVVDTAGLDGAYWYRSLRQTVLFEQTTRLLLEDSFSAFVEVSPHPVLTMAVEETAEAMRGEPEAMRGEPEAMRGEAEAMRGEPDAVAVIGSLRREQGGLERFLCSLAEAHVHGVQVDWAALFAGRGARRVSLPTYAFQRRRYWLASGAGGGDASALGQSPTGHPLLGAAVELAGDREGLLFTGRLSLAGHSWLGDHAVMGTVLLAGAGFVELALTAAERVGAQEIEELTLHAPLLLSEQEAYQVQLVLSEPDEAGSRSIEIYSRAETSSGELEVSEWTLHASGVLAGEQGPLPGGLQGLGEGWPPPGAEQLDVGEFYERCAEAGYEYGPSFQGLRRAWRSGQELFAEVALPEEQEGQAQGFCVHPALFDAALHGLALGALEGEGEGVQVPFSFSGVRLYARGASELRVHLSAQEGAPGLVAVDSAGDPVLSVERIQLRAIDHAALTVKAPRAHDALFELDWVPLPVGEAGVGRTVLVGEAGVGRVGEGGVGRVVLLGSGEELDGVGLELERHCDLDALQAALERGEPAPEVVLVSAQSLAESAGGERAGGERAGGELAGGGGLAGAVRELTVCVLGLLQGFLAVEGLGEARLVLVTRGALAVRGEAPDLLQAALPGLLRSACVEHPGRLSLIDVDASEASMGVLVGALVSEEPEVALREGELLVPRLARPGSNGWLVPPAGEGPWHLDIDSPGTLESLALCGSPGVGEPLGAGEVRVAVRAAGLNFRDVLIALGVYPGEAPLGSEGAGVVVEVAADVRDLAVGDRVMGLIPYAFGPLAVSDRRLLVRVPEGWSYAEAASVPTVFLTAYYALVDLAQVKRGESLLLHGAAGGVGMAALQIAAYMGVEVFATAHPSKWETLRGLGIDDEHICSSRDVEFKEKFLETTGGRGVDVVLDSLVGEFVDASLQLLPRGGRFIEMGKADIREPGRVAVEYPGVSYRAFDLLEAGAERIQEMLAEVMGLFERGVLHHLPISRFDVRRAPEAFRVLRESRHTGKVVLEVPQPPTPESTILITGGTGGLGALLAHHLVEQGARRLLLISRSGLKAQGARELKSSLQELGAKVKVAACDVTQPTQLKQVIAQIPKAHPLSAVIHTAGVIDDGVISSLDGERLKRVMDPKVTGALNLHELTKDMELSEFILFSSAAGTLGSPGQGNYAAANTFLDALAAARRAEGLPGSSLAWGQWAEASGMTGHLGEADLARLERSGILALSSEQGLELFDTARAVGQPLLLAVSLDLAVLRAAARLGLLPGVMRGLVRAPARRAAAAGGQLARRLREAPESEWEAIVLDLVRGQVASVLGHTSSDAVQVQRNFKDAGFDSLAAVELRNRLVQATGLKLPATLIFDHPTPAVVAAHLRLLALKQRAKRGTKIDDELTRLEEMLATIVSDESERQRVRSRLQVFSSYAYTVLTPDTTSRHDDPHDNLDLGSVTDEEMFEFIDQRRGMLLSTRTNEDR